LTHCEVGIMGRKIILDNAAAEQGKGQLRQAKESFSCKGIPNLKGAESTLGSLSLAKVQGVGKACLTASQTLQKLNDFEGALNTYIQTISQYDYDVASLIRNVQEFVEWSGHSGWNADPGELERRILDRLILGGMTRAQAKAFMADSASALLGLSSSSVYCGDPINMSTGNFIYQKEDIKIAGAFPLAFKRFYNAVDNEDGPLGLGWTHSFNNRLDDRGTLVRVVFEDGHQEAYRQDAQGVYQAPDGRYRTLEKREDTFVLVTKEQFEYHFTKDGKISFTQDANGNVTQYCYAEGLLKTVSSASGSFSFAYTADNLLLEVQDHAGRMVSYGYEDGCLVSVKQSEGGIYRYRYNKDKRISQLVSPEGVVAIENTYDSAFRTTSQRMADGGCLDLFFEDDTLSVTAKEQNGNQVIYVRDANYRTAKVVHQKGIEQFEYDSHNNRTLYADRNGNVHRFAYDQKGNLVEAVDPLNKVTGVTYNQFSKPVQVTNPDDSIVRYSYDQNGNLTKRIDPLGRLWKFEYASSGLPCRVMLPDASTSTVTYDQRGNIISLSDHSGATITYNYNSLNQVTSSTDADGHTTCFFYNQHGDIVRTTDALGHTYEFEYDQSDRLVRTVDFSDNETRFEYNKVNKVERIIDAAGGITHYTYDLMWNITSATDPEGNTTNYEYDLDNRLVAVTDPEGGVMRFEHDACGNITAVLTKMGSRTTVEYDAMNRAVRQIEPDGTEVQYAYDAAGRLVRVLYQNGCEETRTYDAAGQLVAMTNIQGETTRFGYTPLGQVHFVINQKGDELRYEYYPGGRLKSVSMPGGEAQHYIWNNNGKVAQRTDALGNATKMAYDALGRVIEVCNPLGGIRRFGYDPMGRLTMATDANGNTTRYRYSPLGMLIEVIDATGQSTHYGYDAARRLTAVEQTRIIDPALGDIMEAEQQLTRYEYNRRGDVTAVYAPMGKTERYAYDRDGRLVSKQDADGFETNFSYTPFGQLEQVLYADGRQVRLKYGELRRLAEVQDWLGVTTIKTDPAGRVAQVIDPDGRALGYEWDEAGRQKSLVYPDGSVVNYAYDVSGHLAEVQSTAGITRYCYDAAGRLVHQDMPGGIETDYSTDSLGRITRITHLQGGRQLDDLQYSYDQASNVARIQKSRRGVDADSGVFTYAYDALNRLVAAARDGKERRYAYDSLGNRIAVTDGDGRQSYCFNALNQLIESYNGKEREEYRYDGRGNLTDVLRGDFLQAHYCYDSSNMLVEAHNAQGDVAHYAYDGLGNRAAMHLMPQNPGGNAGDILKDAAQTVRYLVDITKGFNNLVGTVSNSGQTQNFIWGNSLLTAEGSSSYSYLLDHLGSPIRLQKDGDGTPLAYDEFGVPLAQAGNPGMPLAQTDAALRNPFGFTGYQVDEASGLYYAQARYYDPHSSRMTSADSWGGTRIAPQSMNRYSYCVNNPVSLVDRNGRWPDIPLPPSLGDVLKYSGGVANGAIGGILDATDSISGASPVIKAGLKGGVAVGNFYLGGVSLVGKVVFWDPNFEINAGDVGAKFLMMEKDSDGIYHATFDCWQQWFGYNDVYDAVFDLGTSMKEKKLDFTYDGKEYVVWAWRGDYLNLGAGGELGIYRQRIAADGTPIEHWDADTGLAMPMTLRLKNINGTSIFAYYPTDPQWWITGFDPHSPNVPADQLIALYSIDFSGDPEMFAAFRKEWEDDCNTPGLLFNPFTYGVTFTFTPEGMEGACIV
jgi:RHS repeat-associated protein